MNNFKAVSMPCTEQQWLNEVKPLCDKYGLKYDCIGDFEHATILTNNLASENIISNISKRAMESHNGKVIPYNPIEFIKACGVEVFPEKWCVKGDGNRFLELVEKMGWSREYWEGTGKENFYAVVNNVLQYYTKEELPEDYTEVTLDELIKHYEGSERTEQPKWEKLTRGGYEYNIVREDRGDSMINVEIFINNVWSLRTLCNNGKYRIDGGDYHYDLIPYNPRKTELLTKKAELEKQLEEINKELNQ